MPYYHRLDSDSFDDDISDEAQPFNVNLSKIYFYS